MTRMIHGGQGMGMLRVLGLSYAALAALFAAIAAIGMRYQIPLGYFTRDPAVLLHGHPLTGFVSHIGVLFWCATAAICFFVATVQQKIGNGWVCRFFFWGGGLTVLLLLDDLFMFHDELAPHYLHIRQFLVYLFYLVCTAAYLVKFRRFILAADFRALACACVFFALSMASDELLPASNIEFFFEDAFKLFGIVSWCLYFAGRGLTATLQTGEP